MAEYHCDWVRKSEIVLPFVGIPALSSSRATLDYLLSTTPIDLCSVAEEVTSDLGLSAHVVTTALAEFGGSAEECPAPEDCIVLLGSTWLRDIVRTVPVIDPANDVRERLYGVSRYSRRVAFLSRTIAVACGYPQPAHAYWAGLFHNLGSISILLRPKICARSEEWNRLDRMIGPDLALNSNLPLFITDVIEHLSRPQSACDPLLAAIVAFSCGEGRKSGYAQEDGRKGKYLIRREGCA